MAPTLYMIPPSPPVRAVQITAKALGIQLNEKPLDFFSGEHTKPDYLKINPQHTVPTLVEEDGFTLWDSHAITTYLVQKYGKNDSLYPKDLKKRAIIDQRLHFDSGVAFTTGAQIVRPIIVGTKKSVEEADIEKLHNVFGFVEAFLDGKPWLAGDNLTIADYHIWATLSSGNLLVPITADKFPKLSAWFKKVDALPETEASKPGLAAMAALLKSRLQ